MLGEIETKKDPALMNVLREKIEELNEENLSPDKAIDDIRNMRDNYQEAGGRDSHFLANLNNLEKFYYRKRERRRVGGRSMGRGEERRKEGGRDKRRRRKDRRR